MPRWRVSANTTGITPIIVDADDELEAIQEFFDGIAPSISVEPWPDDDDDDDDDEERKDG